MRTKTAVLLFAAAALACRGRSGPAQRAQQQYDVVQEGQTTSASTTVGAPGEVQPVTTATNTDTTGSFTLGTAPVPANMPGGPATGVLPPQQPGTMASSMPPMGSAPAAPTPPPRPVTIVRTPSQTPVLTNTQPPPPRTTERRPPPPPPPADATTTSSDTAATSTTDTSATTDTTSTEEKPKKDKKDSGDKTDTSAPPPPTQTDTIGNH